VINLADTKRDAMDKPTHRHVTLIFLKPCRRLRLSIRRPEAVFIRALNPCLRSRFILLLRRG